MKRSRDTLDGCVIISRPLDHHRTNKIMEGGPVFDWWFFFLGSMAFLGLLLSVVPL